MSLQKLKCLSIFQQRKAAAILGALLADAAIAPLHWIYDQGKVADLVEKQGAVEFYPTSQCPFYTIPTGNNTTYGDELYATLKNIAENKGFDASKSADALFKFYGPGTIYEDVRNQPDSPKKGPWTNHCIKIFVANREEGKVPAGDPGSKDPDGFCRSVAIAGLLDSSASEGDLDAKVRACVEIAQLDSVPADFALGGFGILENTIRTGQVNLNDESIAKFKPDVQEGVRKARGCTDGHTKAAKGWSLACSYPNSFIVGVHGIKCATSYVEAVRSEAMAGGDTCSRVIMVGSVCGARYGLDAIPEDWLKQYNRAEEVLGYIETVVQL